MSSLSRTILRGFLNLIYPNACWTCGQMMPEDVGPVCDACRPLLTVDPFPTCPRCSTTVGPHGVLANGCPSCRDQTLHFDGAIRMAPYEGLLRDSILRMKHWTGEELAEVLAGLAAKQLRDRLDAFKPDIVIPVPLHWWRRWARGFNQSAVIARCLASELGITHLPRALRRIRATPQQTAQPNGTARRENVKHAFGVRPGVDLAGKSVLLVDDVLTTGATASEAARALRTLKPKAIHVVVLAHGN